LRKVYPEGFNISPVVRNIKEASERERIAEQAVGWSTIFFPTPAIKRMLLVGVGTAISQQAVGIDAIQYYLIDVLEESGVESEKGRLGILILLGVLKLMFILVGGKLFDRRGRKPLFYASLLGMAVALFLISLTFSDDRDRGSGFVVFGLALYLSFFSIGMGPGAWLIPSEVFATSIRAKAMSVATFFNRMTATLMSSTFLSLVNHIGWRGFFLMLGGICVTIGAFFFFLLPETKGRSLEEMTVYFAEITNDSSILDAEAKIVEERERSGAVELTTSQSPQNAPKDGELI